MSRIGRKPIPIAKGVKVEKSGDTLKVKGPKGEMSTTFPASLSLDITATEILVGRSSDLKTQKALHGTWRALINN